MNEKLKSKNEIKILTGKHVTFRLKTKKILKSSIVLLLQEQSKNKFCESIKKFSI